jgi:hypothetical protein
MKNIKSFCVILSVMLVGASLSTLLRAQDNSAPAKSDAKPTTQPSEAEMMARMMELGKPGAQHKLLAQRVGTWDYKLKFSMVPGTPLAEAGHGTAVCTSLMDGRYFSMDVTGKMQMPGADGKMTDADFKGMSLDGYDNMKQKFVSAWIDNTGTSIQFSQGTYDQATKSFTYLFDIEVMPGKMSKARQVVQMLDADHEQMDWYESHAGKEVKTLEIDYTRRK